MFVEEKLDLILKQMEKYHQRVELFVPDLRKKRNVAVFLDISEQCLVNWLNDSDSPVQEGIHYCFNSRDSVEFVPDEIILLKLTGTYKNRRNSNKSIVSKENGVTTSQLNKNPVTMKILQKIGKIPSCEEAPKGDVF